MWRKGKTSRREFLQGSVGVCASAIAGVRRGWAAGRYRFGNPVVAPWIFTPLPLGSIRPQGWLRAQLEIQANGLSGHLDETWADVGPNSGWLGGTGERWERGPYWLDGLVPLAYGLDDARLKAKVQPWMEWTLKSQDSTGNFGPKTKENDWWPRMVMLKALVQYQEATDDARVVPYMERYFAYQVKALPTQPLTSWGKYRWQDNVLTIWWLHDRNGDPKLLELAKLLRTQGHDWRAEFADFPYTQKMTKARLQEARKTGGFHETHGVDIAMGLKSAAVWSRISQDAGDRNSAIEMLAALDRFHGLPNGMYSADEHLAGRGPIQGTELCTVVEAMFSLEQALAASGDPRLADRLEIIGFNALPGGISYDMWSHQYDQEPNQIECSLRPRPWSNNGPESNLFGLEPNFGCCCANFHQGWPKLTSSLWMKSEDGGLAAMVYAPCVVSTTVDGVPVKLETVTEYPFRNTVEIHVTPQGKLSFPLRLRVPSWGSATVQLNSKNVSVEAQGGFVTLQRSWQPGDVVKVEFAMEPRAIAGVDGTVSFRRGPLVFALPIEEKWNKLRDRGLTADWEVLGASSWNYAVVGPVSINVESESAVSAIPFGRQAPPVTLEVKARRVANWKANDGVAGDFPAAPEVQDAAIETVTLVPYASTKLRMTALPRIKP